MIELLSRLDAGTSRFIADNLDTVGERPSDPDRPETDEEKVALEKRRRCPTCRGRKRLKRPSILGVQASWEECPRCHGTGRTQGATSKATRMHRREGLLTPEQIAWLCSGMKKHVFQAAVLHVTHDPNMRRVVAESVTERLIEPIAEGWRLPEGVTPIRTLGLARVVTEDLMLREGQRLDDGRAIELMCCHPRDWSRTWRRHEQTVAEQARGWLLDADAHMARARNLAA